MFGIKIFQSATKALSLFVILTIFCIPLFDMNIDKNTQENSHSLIPSKSKLRTNSLFCQELFTTPILTKLIWEKLCYKKTTQNHQTSSIWKIQTKMYQIGAPPFTFTPYEALARTLPPLLTEKLEPVNSKQQRGSLAYTDYINIFSNPTTIPTELSWVGADKEARIEFGKHSDIHVTTQQVTELSVRYVYSSFLTEEQWGAGMTKPSIVQVLKDQLDIPAHILPKLIVIGTGTWAIYGDVNTRDTLPLQSELLRNLDWLLQSIREAGRELRGTLQQLKMKGVNVVWMLPDNVKTNVTDWSTKVMFTSPCNEWFFEWINEILLNTLMDFHVQGLLTIWDSNHVISSQVIHACRQLLRSGTDSGWDLGTSREWGCGDITHSGPQASHRYAQILLNYMCNDKHQLCCGDN